MTRPEIDPNLIALDQTDDPHLVRVRYGSMPLWYLRMNDQHDEQEIWFSRVRIRQVLEVQVERMTNHQRLEFIRRATQAPRGSRVELPFPS